jgi:ferredoxin
MGSDSRLWFALVVIAYVLSTCADGVGWGSGFVAALSRFDFSVPALHNEHLHLLMVERRGRCRCVLCGDCSVVCPAVADGCVERSGLSDCAAAIFLDSGLNL